MDDLPAYHSVDVLPRCVDTLECRASRGKDRCSHQGSSEINGFHVRPRPALHHAPDVRRHLLGSVHRRRRDELRGGLAVPHNAAD